MSIRFPADPNVTVVLKIPSSLYSRAEASRRRLKDEDESYGSFALYALNALRVAIECDEDE